MSKHTPGPLMVQIQEKWPFDIHTLNADGNVVFVDRMPCHASRDRTVSDVMMAANFSSQDRQEVIAKNERAVADAQIRSAAPDLLEALELILLTRELERNLQGKESPLHDRCRAAIAKAKGEKP